VRLRASTGWTPGHFGGYGLPAADARRTSFVLLCSGVCCPARVPLRRKPRPVVLLAWSPAHAEKRVALVIGNAAYKNVGAPRQLVWLPWPSNLTSTSLISAKSKGFDKMISCLNASTTPCPPWPVANANGTRRARSDVATA
jgi:hypothetical protein